MDFIGVGKRTIKNVKFFERKTAYFLSLIIEEFNTPTKLSLSKRLRMWSEGFFSKSYIIYSFHENSFKIIEGNNYSGVHLLQVHQPLLKNKNFLQKMGNN